MVRFTRIIDFAFQIGFDLGYELGKAKKKRSFKSLEYEKYLYDLKDKLKKQL